MKRILLVSSQHGDERLGEQLHRYIKTYAAQLSDSVTFVIANPLAYSLKQRYIETDMNRSYTTTPESYEEYLASALLCHIQHANYDLVLDMHTTHCDQPPSMLKSETSHPEVDSFIAASTIPNIVTIAHPIVHASLIGHVPNSISIEYQAETITKSILEALTADILRYIHDEQSPGSRSYYQIYDLLAKGELSISEVSELRNFELCTAGFYPILVGNNSYRRQTKYLGFKAKRLHI